MFLESLGSKVRVSFLRGPIIDFLAA